MIKLQKRESFFVNKILKTVGGSRSESEPTIREPAQPPQFTPPTLPPISPQVHFKTSSCLTHWHHFTNPELVRTPEQKRAPPIFFCFYRFDKDPAVFNRFLASDTRPPSFSHEGRILRIKSINFYYYSPFQLSSALSLSRL